MCIRDRPTRASTSPTPATTYEPQRRPPTDEPSCTARPRVHLDWWSCRAAQRGERSTARPSLTWLRRRVPTSRWSTAAGSAGPGCWIGLRWGLPGLRRQRRLCGDIHAEKLRSANSEAAAALGPPPGRYRTVVGALVSALDGVARRWPPAVPAGCRRTARGAPSARNAGCRVPPTADVAG